jgi:anti-sigma B factor antagonist
MPDAVPLPTYLVDIQCDPVAIRIDGRASFQNCASLADFFKAMRAQRRMRFVVDFAKCTSMDSTFLGVLAGVALDIRKAGGGVGQLVLARVGPRNLELIRNLGLHRLLTIDTGEALAASGATNSTGTALPISAALDELANARIVLAAHENLVAADETNQVKFQDVLAFLKDRVAQG